MCSGSTNPLSLITELIIILTMTNLSKVCFRSELNDELTSLPFPLFFSFTGRPGLADGTSSEAAGHDKTYDVKCRNESPTQFAFDICPLKLYLRYLFLLYCKIKSSIEEPLQVSQMSNNVGLCVTEVHAS